MTPPNGNAKRVAALGRQEQREKREAPLQPVFTIGHSTRSLEQFIALLQTHAVTRVVDVRTIPRSRHNPQFNRDTLPEALASAGITYRYLAKLGGLRHAVAGSPNTGWRNASFRGFADYMQTSEFAEGINDLLDVARDAPTVIMCAEAVPWRCHRSLIADALSVRGIPVAHIIGAERTRAHQLTRFARVDGMRITYPAAEEENVSPNEGM